LKIKRLQMRVQTMMPLSRV